MYIIDEEINKLRRRMIKIGMTKGLSSKEALIPSKKLDNLINLIMIIQKNRCK